MPHAKDAKDAEEEGWKQENRLQCKSHRQSYRIPRRCFPIGFSSQPLRPSCPWREASAGGVERQSQPNTLLCLTLRAQRTQRGGAATKRVLDGDYGS